MAISDVYNYGLLNRWCLRMAESMYHFNQMAGVNAPLSRAGDYVYVQYERQIIADAINQVIPLIVAHLGFYPRPEYVSERIDYGRGGSLALKYGYIKAIGRRATSEIDSAAAVVYSGDTATITVNTTITDISEIQVFFTVADGADSVASELYRIEPVRVIANGTTATITGHRALFCKPSNWAVDYVAPNYNDSDKKIWDSNDSANYVTSVDVYRVYPDATNAVNLLYGNPFCSAGDYEYSTVAGTARLNDSKAGIVTLFDYPGGCCSHRYEKADIYYLAGYPLDSLGEYNRSLRDAVLMMANCHLSTTLTPFDQKRLGVMQYDTVIRTVNDQPIDDKTPFGQAYGQVRAWETVTALGLGQGGALI